ncbi:MAG TPA: DUF4062 domain-containing protein [Nocardioidaceae bacterium]|nr:DUF4062 domain-containing protein [Nocardioidaceae bacterium]
MIRTPDQRLRVFVSSTLGELAPERQAVRRAVERLHLSPVMFELGARPHPPRQLYRAYLEQSDVFVGVYWQSYGWVAPGEDVSGLEDEYQLAAGRPQLLYIKHPAPERDEALSELLGRIQTEDQASYRRFSTPEELEHVVAEDLAVMLSERFGAGGEPEVARRPVAPLPAPLTRTIGRDRDTEEVVRLLDEGVRLVTVTGPGGVGKTRLALEAARKVARRPGAEVHFVPLATVGSPSLVLASVADRLGVRGMTGTTPFDSLVEYFGDRPALLLLDNLEQVVAVGPELGRLLARLPGLQMLATSRQALRVLGEHEVVTGPLDVPGRSATPEDVARAPSVELLLERARARGMTLAVTAENASAVAGLCRRLGGLPLAIELAVPRLRLLSPRALLERLGSTLDLPAAGGDLPSRQRTLRDALAWSHDLLESDERALFARLSVFGGGATLEAVDAVCSDDGLVIDTALAGLLDKSLVLIGNPSPEGDLRIQMLEPVRDFAEEQLDLREETAALRRRHMEWVAALGREAQPFLCGPRQREWADRFDAERANLRAAVETGLAWKDFESVLRLTWDTMVYYYIRDALDEPRDWLVQVARDADDLPRTQQALLDVGLLIAGVVAEPEIIEPLLDEPTEVFDREGLPLEAAVSRQYLGLHHWHSGRPDVAIDVLRDASRRYASIGHDWGVAQVEMTLGAAFAAMGDLDEARRHLHESLSRSRHIENHPQMAQALQGLALVDALDNRLGPALEELSDATDLVLADHSLTGATYCLEALAAVVRTSGDPGEAVRLIGAARTTRSRRAIPEWTAAAGAAEPVLAAARRELSSDVYLRSWRDGAQDPDVFALLGSHLAEVVGEREQAGSLATEVR